MRRCGIENGACGCFSKDVWEMGKSLMQDVRDL